MSLFQRKNPAPGRHPGAPLELTMRLATASDGPAVHRLAALDSAPRPSEPVLLAEIGGELWVAVSLRDLALIADPFRPSGELAVTVLERARRLTAPAADIRSHRGLRAVAARLGTRLLSA